MELIDKFNQKSWTKVEAETNQCGYLLYRVAQRTPVSPKTGEYKYGVMSADGDFKLVKLFGASSGTDPIAGIANLELKLEDEKVVGLKVEDECVKYIGD